MPPLKTGIYVNPYNGYCYYNTKKNRKRLVHRVIWEEKFGKIPIGYEIHHKDGNKENNKIENLELVFSKKHISDKHPEVIEKMVKNSIAIRHKIKIENKNKVVALFNNGIKIKKIMQLFNLGQTTVYRYLSEIG